MPGAIATSTKRHRGPTQTCNACRRFRRQSCRRTSLGACDTRQHTRSRGLLRTRGDTLWFAAIEESLPRKPRSPTTSTVSLRIPAHSYSSNVDECSCRRACSVCTASFSNWLGNAGSRPLAATWMRDCYPNGLLVARRQASCILGTRNGARLSWTFGGLLSRVVAVTA
jgi:hypothetical protein